MVWREKINPLLAPQNPDKSVLTICQYGFTEMLNNVVDHSEAESCMIDVTYSTRKIEINIRDNGIGIFNKIKKAYKLEDQRHALLELAKGKLTTDPKHHSGQGVFFTSRAFDKFSNKIGVGNEGGAFTCERNRGDRF